MKQVWQCDFCGCTMNDHSDMIFHEDQCCKNPKSRSCDTCENAVKKTCAVPALSKKKNCKYWRPIKNVKKKKNKYGLD